MYLLFSSFLQTIIIFSIYSRLQLSVPECNALPIQNIPVCLIYQHSLLLACFSCLRCRYMCSWVCRYTARFPPQPDPTNLVRYLHSHSHSHIHSSSFPFLPILPHSFLFLFFLSSSSQPHAPPLILPQLWRVRACMRALRERCARIALVRLIGLPTDRSGGCVGA